MLYIKGIQKTSLIDYPPYIVATLFLGYCNFRCPFCHNPDLVLNADKLGTLMKEDVLKFLREKKLWLDGVCITGGEPTLSHELPEFIKSIKSLGLCVKLDTNGSNPKMLRELIDQKLVDYIAMDIKAPLEGYDKITVLKADIDKIRQSIELLKESAIDYEFRLTAVPGLISGKEILQIGKELSGSKRFFIQQFSSNKDMIDSKYKGKQPFSLEQLERFKRLLEPFILEISIRNI